MYIEKLEVGQTYKNWKVLCETLGEEIKSGSGKKFQVKEFSRYFSWSKEGQKITITEIYDEPKEKIDGRKQNGKNFSSLNALNNHRYTQPKAKFNKYKICGDYTEIYIENLGETYICLTDTEDLNLVKQERKYYLHCNHVCSKEKVWIHRLIMGLPKLEGRLKAEDLVVHHINRNPLDNRKSNLIVLTQEEHMELHSREYAEEMKQYWAKNKEEVQNIAFGLKEILLENGIDMEDANVKKALKMLSA